MDPNDMEERSPAMIFMDHFRIDSFRVVQFSKQTYQGELHNLLLLLCRSGVEFFIDDFSVLAKNGGISLDEWLYTSIVNSKNMTAARAFEHWMGRPPFIFDDIEPFMEVRKKAAGRLSVGTRFRWNNETVNVTSFSDDGTYIVACSYQKDVNGRELVPAKISRRYKISSKDLKTERIRRKRFGILKQKFDYRSMFWFRMVDLYEQIIDGEKITEDGFYGMFVR